MTKYKVGSTVTGNITGIEKYGAFVSLDDYYSGLIHISEISEGFVKDINDLRPFLMNDGGNIEFVKIDGNILYVTLQGACKHCPMQEITLKDGIERTIIDKVPEIKEVRIIEEV